MLFTRAYTANPLCKPLRCSLFTGHYPHQTGVQTNRPDDPLSDKLPCLGKLFCDDYETAYFGKWHIARSFGDVDWHGFHERQQKGCIYNSDRIVEFLKREHDRPFLAVASFMNPHDICQIARYEPIRHGALGELPPVEKRPPLPKNFGIPEDETDTIAWMRRSYQTAPMFPVGNYTDAQWRRLIWGYYRLVEMVDQRIGETLSALEEAGLEEETLVVFLSDHGDCHGAHHWNQKTVFYDESARVPLIFSQPGVIAEGTTCDRLVNTGVDLLPTLCQIGDGAMPDDLPGESLVPLLLGKEAPARREYVIVQNHMVQGAPVEGKSPKPRGRMVRSDRYKYCVYDWGEHRESLVDMQSDPGEMRNLARKPEYRQVLHEHRRLLEAFAREHHDDVALAMLRDLAD
jgi:arylsulfatase A-like enzyme